MHANDEVYSNSIGNICLGSLFVKDAWKLYSELCDQSQTNVAQFQNFPMWENHNGSSESFAFGKNKAKASKQATLGKNFYILKETFKTIKNKFNKFKFIVAIENYDNITIIES